MTWIPVILIWAALITIGAYYIREWWRVGRDPKGTTIIPRFAAPEGLSPMALFFIYRRATAEDVAINAGALGSLAELIRRKLVRIEEAPAGPQIVAQEGGDGEGLQEDLVKFLDRLIPRGRAATTEDFRKAAYQHWIDIHAMLAKRIISFNLGITLSGAVILIAAALVTVVLVNWTLPAGNDGALIMAGLVASLLVFAALAMRRSRVRMQRMIALGLGLSGFFIILVVIVLIVSALDRPAGLERALVMTGLFLTLPVISFAWGAMMALTPEGRRLYDEVEGFRMFIKVADAGRHAIDNAPDPTEDSLDRLMPYAIALHVESGWVNALAASLPLKRLAQALAKRRATAGPPRR